MSPRTGRPKIANPKLVQVSARLTQETVTKLNAAADHLETTKAEVIRMGIERVYGDIKKED